MKILEEIQAERARQDAKWGVQDHPSVDPILAQRIGPYGADRMCHEYEIPTEDRAKFLCENAFANGYGTYAHIAIEEMSEVVAAPNDAHRREELIQLAAVCVAWIESIDRRAALKGQ